MYVLNKEWSGALPVFENPEKPRIAPILILVSDSNLLENISIPILWLVNKVLGHLLAIMPIASEVVDMVVGAVLENQAEIPVLDNCDLGVSEFADFVIRKKAHDLEVSVGRRRHLEHNGIVIESCKDANSCCNWFFAAKTLSDDFETENADDVDVTIRGLHPTDDNEPIWLSLLQTVVKHDERAHVTGASARVERLAVRCAAANGHRHIFLFWLRQRHYLVLKAGEGVVGVIVRVGRDSAASVCRHMLQSVRGRRRSGQLSQGQAQPDQNRLNQPSS